MHSLFANNSWLKSRGYLHITPKIDIGRRAFEIKSKIENENFVEKHAFFPLIHSVIKERKYKKHPINSKLRAHSHKIDGKPTSSVKKRPLHYSTHIDSLIFGYYAELLSIQYEKQLDKYTGLSESIIAYRKIRLHDHSDNRNETYKGKSTIHFAKEAFEEIKRRANEDCVVLMFDIKSFFSELNHDKLKLAWCKLLNVTRLNKAHFNVFKAATDFRYILLDELRLPSEKGTRKKGFDETKLSYIRKNKGEQAFFESIEEFKESIKNKVTKVYKHPFVRDKLPMGIPQGLPISAILANIYLLEFDKTIFEKVVLNENAYYRRYSDDILIVCKPSQAESIEKVVLETILESKLRISTEKTERYLFKTWQISPYKKKLVSILLEEEICKIGKPLTYLGFEFYGDKILVKSANLAKFYRRLIYSVKRQANRANKSSGSEKPVIFRGRLKKKYSFINLDEEPKPRKRFRLKIDEAGYYQIKHQELPTRFRTNYISYVNRASKVMHEPAIKNQIRKHKTIFNEAVAKHLNRYT